MKPTKHPTNIRLVIDANHYPPLTPAHKVRHSLVILEPEYDTIARHLPIQRVHVVKRMWPVVAFSAFKPRSVLDIDPSQPLPCCLQLFFNPQKNDGLAALSRSNSTLFGLIVNGAVFLFADGIHRHNGSLINDLVHQPTARSPQPAARSFILRNTSPLFRSHKKTPQT